jgi:hypothetical protein
METYVDYVKLFEILKDLDMRAQCGGTHFAQDEINPIVVESDRKSLKVKKFYSTTESISPNYLIFD